MADIERALSTLASSTGNYLIPEVIDPTIRDYVFRASPVLNIVTRVPWPTNVYTIRKRTARPTPTWKLDDTALPAATRSSYAKQSKLIKYIYIKGSVTGPEIEAAAGVVNALQEEIRVASEAMGEDLALKIFLGDAASNPEEIDGILEQVNTSTPGDEGGTITAASKNLSLKLLDEAIDGTLGEGDVILLSRAMRRKVNALLQGSQRFNDSIEIGGGFRVRTYDTIPLVSDPHWDDDTKFVVLRKSDFKLLVHRDFSFEPLAKVSDAEDFFIRGYFGLALEGRPVLVENIDLASATPY